MSPRPAVRPHLPLSALAVAVAVSVTVVGCSREPEPPTEAAAQDGTLAVVDETLAPHFKNAFRLDGMRFTGKPTAEGLKLAHDGGVGLVVNILSAPETEKLDFDVAATTKELGMEYAHLPLVDRKPTKEVVDRFADLLEGREEGVLVHCGSSNRVGALWAAYQGLRGGASPEEAIARGKAAGMKSDKLVEAVEELLRGP